MQASHSFSCFELGRECGLILANHKVKPSRNYTYDSSMELEFECIPAIMAFTFLLQKKIWIFVKSLMTFTDWNDSEIYSKFCWLQRELDVDMQSVKELHSEILNSLTKKIKPDELLERSSKAGKLFKTIVARRILLEEEAQHIREMSENIAEREGLNMETDAPKDTGIDAVINKLKTLVHDLDSREDKTRVSFFFAV